jgi:hypothetical protein
LYNWYNPICSMYAIFTNICPKNNPKVGKYTIHGAYGNYSNMMYYVPYLILKYGITLCLYPTFHIFSTFFFIIGSAAGVTPVSRSARLVTSAARSWLVTSQSLRGHGDGPCWSRWWETNIGLT